VVGKREATGRARHSGSTGGRRATSALALLLATAALLAACSLPGQRGGPRTALERSRWKRLTTSAELSTYLAALDAAYPEAERVLLGTSAGGRPLEALVLSAAGGSGAAAGAAGPSSDDDERLVVLLVGSQHGMEPSGAEALALIARDVLAGPLRPLVDGMDLVVIPNGNPDGRETGRRTNGRRVNLSTNFSTLTEPESRAVRDALVAWRPHVVLDVHESAAWKAESLAAEGYLTVFEAQLEPANNPNVDLRLRALAFERLLPEVIDAIRASGLPAQRYIGEITSVAQPITHGGLSLENLRNYAGMLGAVSFLLENRLDPPARGYATPRNIRRRVAKQRACIVAFLEAVHARRAEIAAAVRAAREAALARGPDAVYLAAEYVPDPTRPWIVMPFQRLEDGARIERLLPYRGAVAARRPLALPDAYLVTARREEIAELLERQGIGFARVTEPRRVPVVVQRVVARRPAPRPATTGASYVLAARHEEYAARPGDLWVPLDQPARRLIPLLLEPGSSSSVLRKPPYASWVTDGEDVFVLRVPRDGASHERRRARAAPAATTPARGARSAAP
jgi:hypothetical protein